MQEKLEKSYFLLLDFPGLVLNLFLKISFTENLTKSSLAKGGLISESILTLVSLPKRGAKSCP